MDMSAEEEDATALYNDACDMLEGNNSGASTTSIAELLSSTIDILSALHEDIPPLIRASSCVLLARACILLGQLLEWKDNAAALANYKRASEVDPSNPEAFVQLGRCLWKEATSKAELKIVEEHLRAAISLCHDMRGAEEEAEDGDATDDGEDIDIETDPTVSEANNLLARLLSQSPGRHAETKLFLADIGYKYTLSNWMTTTTSMGQQQSSSSSKATRKSSKRLQNANVCAFDNTLSPGMLQYMQNTFTTNSPFWSEHGYDSPTSGFFSYQLPLFDSKARDESRMNSFETIIHSIWDTAKQGMPKLKAAKYAEWWCHSRPHCNGHKLHYDFVLDNGGTVPRFPIASTVTFITAGN
jgi:tetratricopeptide (TPR) repeat protein